MKTKLFIITILGTFTTLAYAQKLVEIPLNAYEMNIIKSESRAFDSEVYIPWGYCENNIVYAIGIGKEVELSAAIYVPQTSLGVYKKARVAGIRIGLADKASNISVFLKEGNDLEAPDKINTTGLSSLDRGFHNIMFRVPYQITGDIIVGYTSTGNNHIGYDGAVAYQNANYLRYNQQWATAYNSAVQQGWGSLCIQLLLTGDEMPEREMGIENILNKTQEQNKPFILQGVVRNLTNKPVENYEIACKINNATTVTQQFQVNLGTNEADTFAIEMNPMTEIGNNTIQASVTSVNGEKDSNEANNTIEQTINVIEEGCYFPQKVVIEEGTSTLCGYCPKGIIVMESMKLRYPETFIGIAVHSEMMGSDPMIASNYQDINQYWSGLPSGIVNRKESLCGDPLYFEQYYESEVQKLSIAKVLLTSVSQPKENKITINVEITFNQNMNGNNYRLAFVLLENEVTGFAQSNYYSTGEYGAMGGFEHMPGQVYLTFNNVARGIWDFTGLQNSIPVNIEKKVTYKYSYQLTIPTDIRNQKNLEVVALLLDSNSGEIVQADKLAVGKEISAIIQEATSAQLNIYADNGTIKVQGEYNKLGVYTIDGKEVPNQTLPHGIYIVKVIAKGKTYTKKILI